MGVEECLDRSDAACDGLEGLVVLRDREAGRWEKCRGVSWGD